MGWNMIFFIFLAKSWAYFFRGKTCCKGRGIISLSSVRSVPSSTGLIQIVAPIMQGCLHLEEQGPKDL